MKTCKKCNVEKILEDFPKRKDRKDGHDDWCKQCKSHFRKLYYANHREEEKQYWRTYSKEHRDELTKKSAIYRHANRDKVLQWKKNDRERRKKDPFKKLKHNMGCSIRQTLRANKRNRHWEDILGYSINELMIHIEKQFKNGMSWENYGKWHIDHIKPQSLFIFKDDKDPQFKECWALSNLQPLWAKDNLKKWKHFIK